MNSLTLVTPPLRTRSRVSASVAGVTVVSIMWAPTSTQALPALLIQSSRAAATLGASRGWNAKSTTVVVPPKAAARVAVSNVSAVRADPVS